MAGSNSSSSATSSLSTFAEVTSIAKALNFNLPTKLNGNNYTYWKVQVRSAIRALGLDFLITAPRSGDSSFPTSDSSPQPDLSDEVWTRSDQLLICWLFSNISESIIGQVTECETSFDIWKTLEKLFAQSSMARALQLKQQLGSLKKGASSISEFVMKIKNIGAELKSIDQYCRTFRKYSVCTSDI